MKKRLSILIVVILIVGGLISYFFITKETIAMDIVISKNIYKLGEALDASSRYYLNNKGGSFNGLVLYVESYSTSNGEESNCNPSGDCRSSGDDTMGLLSGEIKQGEFQNKSLYQSKSSSDISPKPFEFDGKYTYTMAVYKCDTVDVTLGTKNCGGDFGAVSSKEIYSKVTPIKSVSKSILVTK